MDHQLHAADLALGIDVGHAVRSHGVVAEALRVAAANLRHILHAILGDLGGVGSWELGWTYVRHFERSPVIEGQSLTMVDQS